MKFFRSDWFYIIAALITIFGILTGWYFFFFLAIPLGLWDFRKKDRRK
ncbi:hypothetical protein [Salinimicrobium sp. WS361]